MMQEVRGFGLTIAKETGDMADSTQTRSYSAGKFMLELEGSPAGFLHSVEGGEPFASVVNEPVDANGVIRKHVGPAEFGPIRMSFGTGMSKAVYAWMREVLNRAGSAKNGAIVFCDYNFKERSRLEFNDALITEIGFPALDLSTDNAASFTLALQPQSTRLSETSKGTTVPGFGARAAKRGLANNFRLKIAGLETACSNVKKIDAVVVKQPLREGGGARTLEIPNVTFTLLDRDAKEFSNWFDDFVLKGINAAENERDGTLEFLGAANQKRALFTLTLSNLGIIRIGHERTENGAHVLARTSVELYCEEMALSTDSQAVGDVDPPPTEPAVPITSRVVDVSLLETLVGIGTGRIRGEDAMRAALRITPELANSNETVQSEFVARRLLATEQSVAVDASVPLRDDGISIGKRWATENATLEELRQVAALESGDWTAMKLDSEHSLIAQLSEAGVIPPGGDGPLDLDRDEFVEGIVAGAARVLRSAAPQLSVLLEKIGDAAEGITENLK